MNGRRMENGGVPPRWLKCPRKSDGFIGGKFIVFKTPLSSQYDDYVPPECRFYPTMIIDYMKMHKAKIGLWIDLTKTSRYYPKNQIEEYDIKYLKLQCHGHDGPPTKEQTTSFVRVCDNFFNNHQEEFIAVHCTHGFNRTGYLVCAYLIEAYDWSVQMAYEEFAKFRPPGIYKQEYIDHLFKEYGDQSDPPPPRIAMLPDWCNEDLDVQDDDGYANANSNSHNNNNNKRKFDDNEEGPSQNHFNPNKRRKEFFKADPKFMEGVGGVEPVTDRDLIAHVQQKVQSICGWRGRHGFPGSQPVSMDRENIRFLAEKPYMVSWKADGTRYMMLIEDKDRIFFIDRDNSIFRVFNMTFLFKKNLNEHLFDTLLDGEMVLDKVAQDEGENPLSVPRYLIYDIVRFRGEEVGKVDFRIRLSCIRDEIVEPREKAKKMGVIDRDSEPFGIRFKTFWFLEDAKNVITGNFTKQLAHEPDGIVFQPCRDPYVSGRCDDVLKWKPPTLNTIDFKLKIVTETGEGLLPTRIGELFVTQLNTPFSTMKATKALQKYDGKIVECKLENNAWVFLRERTDKSFPNAFNTAKSILKSIRDSIREDELLEFIETRRYKK